MRAINMSLKRACKAVCCSQSVEEIFATVTHDCLM